MRVPSKKVTFLICLIGVTILLLSETYGLNRLCNGEANVDCMQRQFSTLLLLLPLLPALFFSATTYFMRENVYRMWILFAIPWTILTMIAIAIAPRYGSDWMLPVEKGSVAMFFMAIFVVVSIIIIVKRTGFDVVHKV